MSQKRVILWSAPRCVSTAFERSMMNMKNSKIFHEPYSLPYYFGPERQSEHYSSVEAIDPQAACRSPTYSSVSELLQEEYDGLDLVFVKNMVYYIDKKFDIFLEDGFKNFKHTFLIRNPKKAVVSLYKSTTNPELTGYDSFDPAKAGFKQMFEFFQFVRSHLDPLPVVVDADDLLDNPEGTMQSYCEALGLEYQKNMTKWTPGPVPQWTSPICLGWHEDVLKSSGIIPRKNKSQAQDGGALDMEDMPAEVVDTIEMSMPCFEALYSVRIRPKNSLSDDRWQCLEGLVLNFQKSDFF